MLLAQQLKATIWCFFANQQDFQSFTKMYCVSLNANKHILFLIKLSIAIFSYLPFFVDCCIFILLQPTSDQWDQVKIYSI